MISKEKRIQTFYNDGMNAIVKLLRQIGYPEEITIPKRYRRHMDYLKNGEL